MRPAFTTGRTFLVRTLVHALVAYVSFNPATASAHPTDFALDVLHLGSRTELGLGGDPLLSPLLRQSGWWDQDLLDDPAHVQLRIQQYLPITHRLSGGDGELKMSYTQLGTRHVIQRWNRRLHLGLSVTSLRSSARLDRELASVSFDETGGSIEGLARLEDLVPGFDIQISGPLQESSSRVFSEGLRIGYHYDLRHRLFLTSVWSRWNSQESLNILLQDEPVDLPLNLEVSNVYHGLRLVLWRGLAFEMDARESDYAAHREISADGWEFLPAAWSLKWQQSLEWSGESHFRLLVRHSDFSIRGSGAGYWEGQRYTRLSHDEASLDSYLAAAQYVRGSGWRILTDVELGDFDAFGRVDVDSWRFASWQQAWSGAKKVIQFTGDGRWERYHVAYENTRRSWIWGLGLNHYEIYPHATSEEWIHVPFLRPQDYQSSTLSSSRLSLGAIALKARHQFWSVDIEVEVHQFIYGGDHTNDDTPQTPPPPPDPATAAATEGWFGGTYAILRVGYLF